MAKPITIPNTFASATSAIPLSQLDQDFSTLANATNDLATYSNYVADTGAADAFIANYPANTNTSSLTTGLRLQFKAANANTGASTLNVQVNGASIGTASIRLTDGSALPANTIIAGALVDVMYDGTNFQIMNDPSGGQEIISNLTLSGNLTVAGTSTFTGNVTGNVVNTTTSTITNLTSGNVTITGGSIDNISITNLTSLTVDGNTTLGDASGDTLTINGTTVTTPNGLNFDSNTFVIDATNDRVGIGTSSPDKALTVTSAMSFKQGATTRGIVGCPTWDTSYIAFQNGTLAESAANTAIAQDQNGTTLVNAASGQSLQLKTGNSERMRIDSSGNVGIGTSSPSRTLDVTGSSPLRLNTTANNQLLMSINGTAHSQIYANATYALGVTDGGATGTFLYLTQTGNLGLGVAPSAWAGLASYRSIEFGTSAGNGVLGGPNDLQSFANAYYATGWKYAGTGAATSYKQGSGQHIWNIAPSGTAGNAITFTQAMTLDASGNLGIGTTSPVFASGGGLSIYNATAARIKLGDSTSGIGSLDGFELIYDDDAYLWNRENTALIFGTNSTERMRITSTGVVSVASSTVAGWTSPFNAIQLGTTATVMATPGSTQLGQNIYYDGSYKFIGTGYANRYYQNNGDHTWTASSASGSAGGAVTENIVLTLSSSGCLVLKGGTGTACVGIAFPATQSASSDANTLDDYEEGTFTPTLFGATTAGTTTYSTQLGTYTKIGRQVTVSLNVTATATTGTGELRIGGLPFAASSTYLYLTAPYVTGLNWGGGTYLMMLSRPNETNLEMQYMSDDGNAGNQQLTNEIQGILLTLTYFT